MTHQIQQGMGGGDRRCALLVSDQRGLSTIEYVIILVLVAAIAIGTWSAFGHSVKCALGIANDTIGAGIGVDGQVGPQACAKGTPSPGSGNAPDPGGAAKPGGDGEEHKHKGKRVN